MNWDMPLQHQRERFEDILLRRKTMIVAFREQVPVNGCGYFLYILYPGAYVDLNHEKVEMISAYRQLR